MRPILALVDAFLAFAASFVNCLKRLVRAATSQPDSRPGDDGKQHEWVEEVVCSPEREETQLPQVQPEEAKAELPSGATAERAPTADEDRTSDVQAPRPSPQVTTTSFGTSFTTSFSTTQSEATVEKEASADKERPSAVQEPQPSIQEQQRGEASEPQSQEQVPYEATEPPPVGEGEGTREAEDLPLAEEEFFESEKLELVGAEEDEQLDAQELPVAGLTPPKGQPTSKPKTGEEPPHKDDQAPTRVEVGNRGGHPRGPTPRRTKHGRQDDTPRTKPEVVCWKRGGEWIVGVEASETHSASDVQVYQNGARLEKDRSNQDRWCLRETSGQVEFVWNDDAAHSETVPLGEGKCLLFRLGASQRQGRRVKAPSFGSHLVVIGEDCTRDEELSGSPPALPEPVSLEGYKAHFFDLERGSAMEIAFLTSGSERHVIKPASLPVELVGRELADATKGVGPLFAGKPPRIRALNAQVWMDIKTIVVGREGPRRRGWRRAFRPVPDRAEQDLPWEVAARKGGWYFLRFYDSHDDLVESLDFRFLSALRDIKIIQISPVPFTDGHSPVRVEFHHEPGCTIQPVGDIPAIRTERDDEKTILTIPPDPTLDETSWIVAPQRGPQMRVSVVLKRLWWAVGIETQVPLQWTDRRCTLTRADFIATSKKAVWIRVPGPRWADAVSVGFEQSKSQPARGKGTDNAVALPLRNIPHALALSGAGMAHLRLWLFAQEKTYEGALCEVIVMLRCRLCSFEATTEADLLRHVQSLHLDQWFPALTYEEMRRRFPSLPREIYKCSYCPKYFRSDDLLTNPTTAITHHIEHDCPGVSREHKASVQFRVVTSVEEIRTNVIGDLQRIHKCKLCGTQLDEVGPSEMMKHLVSYHKDQLYKLS